MPRSLLLRLEFVRWLKYGLPMSCMSPNKLSLLPIVTIVCTGLVASSFAQAPDRPPQDAPPAGQQGGPGGPGGFGGPGGPGGFGGFGGGRGPGGPMNQQVTKVMDKFDANKDGYLNL